MDWESDPWIRWGHTDIVIGPSTKDYFWGGSKLV